jgi:hypothetical protein
MHIEVPGGKLKSLKDFGAHYLLIVLGILTAVGLEQWRESVHHRKAAKVAQAQMEAEIRENLSELRQYYKKNAENFIRLRDFSRRLDMEIRNGTAKEAIYSTLVKPAIADKSLNLGMGWPTTRREAWEVAVANQSAGHMEPGVLKQYAAVYSAQRDLTGILVGQMSALTSSETLDTFLEAQFGRAEPLQLLKAVRRSSVAVSAVQGNLRELESTMVSALPGEKLGDDPMQAKGNVPPVEDAAPSPSPTPSPTTEPNSKK